MFIRTESLLLRPGWVEDAAELHAAFAREDVVMTLANAPWPYAIDDAVAFLGRERPPHDAGLLVFLRTAGTPRLIGGVGIKGAELGYWIAPSYRGRGYATEAGRALIAAARDSLRLDHLTARHMIENPASACVLRKFGFYPTGEITCHHSAARGETVSCANYALDLSPSMALAA